MHPEAVRGKFITLEGGEGAGKSTQAKKLAVFLSSVGIETVLTREPGGSPFAEKIRSVILSGKARPFGANAEAALFALARADHVRRLIRPALAAGKWVICDRFSDSTYAYQGILGKANEGWLRRVDRWAVGDTVPDATLVLDIDAELGLARAKARAKPDRFEAEGLAFHARLREVFRTLAQDQPQRCILIDAHGDAEAIAGNIRQVISLRFDLPAAPEQDHDEQGQR
jgi:dTMP kinase